MEEISFNDFRRLSLLHPSSFLKFFKELDGFDYFIGEKQIYRWQIWASGYQNAENILLGRTEIEKKDKPPYNPDEF